MGCGSVLGNACDGAVNALARAADGIGRVGDAVGAVVTGSIAVVFSQALFGNPMANYLPCDAIANTLFSRNVFNHHLSNVLCGDLWIHSDNGLNNRSQRLVIVGIGTTVIVITALTSIYLARRACNCSSAQNLQGRIKKYSQRDLSLDLNSGKTD